MGRWKIVGNVVVLEAVSNTVPLTHWRPRKGETRYSYHDQSDKLKKKKKEEFIPKSQIPNPKSKMGLGYLGLPDGKKKEKKKRYRWYLGVR